MTIDDEMLMAFADGELNEIDRARVARVIEGDPMLAGRVAEHRALTAQLAAHFAPIAQTPVPDRLSALLTRDAKIVDFARASEARAARRWLPQWGVGGAIAASLVLGLGIGTQLPDGAPIASRNGTLVAQGDLARALDTQLAATQGNAPVRVLVSFRDDAGALCRGFDGEGLAGIACREDNSWAIRQTQSAARRATGDYRQAGAAEAAIMAAAQEMAVGEPLDAAAEARARDSGWIK